MLAETPTPFYAYAGYILPRCASPSSFSSFYFNVFCPCSSFPLHSAPASSSCYNSTSTSTSSCLLPFCFFPLLPVLLHSTSTSASVSSLYFCVNSFYFWLRFRFEFLLILLLSTSASCDTFISIHFCFHFLLLHFPSGYTVAYSSALFCF